MRRPPKRPPTTWQTRRTPKVFNANFQPRRAFDFAPYRRLWPLVVLLALVVVFYIIGQLPAFRVESVELGGDQSAPLLANLQKLKGESLLSGTLFADVDRVKNSLPALSDLTCRRGIPGTLQCSAHLRHAALYWKSGQSVMAVDADGFAFNPQNPPAGAVIVEDQSAAAVRLGETVASRQTVSNFTALAQALVGAHLTTSELFVSDSLFQCGAVLTGSTDPTVPLAASSPISALFTFDQPISGQVATLVEILKEKHVAIHNHVDLRIPGAAYIQ